MNVYYVLGFVLFVVAVALVVYFATRQTVPAGGLFGAGAGGGRGTSIGTGIAGAFAGAGGIASSIGVAVDSANAPTSMGV